jgi:hypothetical protein
MIAAGFELPSSMRGQMRCFGTVFPHSVRARYLVTFHSGSIKYRSSFPGTQRVEERERSSTMEGDRTRLEPELDL